MFVKVCVTVVILQKILSTHSCVFGPGNGSTTATNVVVVVVIGGGGGVVVASCQQCCWGSCCYQIFRILKLFRFSTDRN